MKKDIASIIKEQFDCKEADELFTAKGELRAKFCKIIYSAWRGHKVHFRWVGTASRKTLDRNSYDYYEEFCRILGLEYETGNDAPRHGMAGYFIKTTEDGRRRLSEIEKACGWDIEKFIF